MFGLNLGVEQPLSELFKDINRPTFEQDRGAAFEEFALFTDNVRLADTQIWTTRIYTLAQAPDDSIPYFPDEDFEV